MEQLTQLLKSYPEVRLTKLTCGCPETDAHAPSVRLHVCGNSDRAEKITDMCEGLLEGLKYRVTRTGPRDIHVAQSYEVKHYSNETVSF